MLKRQACAKFQSQIFDESEVIQILKVVRWLFCQVYVQSLTYCVRESTLWLRLEHWISTPAVRVRIPSGTCDFFQIMHHFLVTNFHIMAYSSI